MRKNGRIVSLAGEKIAITGYLRQERRRVVAEIEQKRAQYQRNVNRATTVLVQGSPHQSYKLERSSGERYGIKIAAAERARACGQPIAVITEAELRILLRGSGLSRRQTAASDGGPLSELGVPHRHGRRAGIREGTITVVDSGDLDRATAVHHRTVDRLADAVQAKGRAPLDPTLSEAAYDLCWLRAQ